MPLDTDTYGGVSLGEGSPIYWKDPGTHMDPFPGGSYRWGPWHIPILPWAWDLSYLVFLDHHQYIASLPIPPSLYYRC